MMIKIIMFFILILFSFSCSSAEDGSRKLAQRPDNIEQIEKLEKKYKKNQSDPETCKKLGLLYFNSNINDDVEKVKFCVKLFKTWLDANPNDPAARAYYAASVGRIARATDNLMEKAKYGKRSWVLLDEAAILYPNSYIVFYLRGIAGAETPKFMKKYKIAIKDFEKVLKMKTDGKTVPDEIMPGLYYFYIKSLKLNDEKDRSKNIYNIISKEYPDHYFTRMAKEVVYD